ncbi:hypothetical protein ABIE44_000248 [Marmoricola sp. OAE513]|uniref:hypothetical protein n=1 Tax=Marmoricola sp. OAE513 TaxID=2817894 RepID=UPI001AE5C1F1
MTQRTRTAQDRRLAAAGSATIVVLSGLALAPVLLSRGFVLIGDMAFVPDQPWSPAWLGLDGSVPRAVPADAVVSVLSQVLAADLLQKVVLLGALLLAGFGMRRFTGSLLADNARLAPLGAAVLYLWNPWVLERLAIGHWGLLLGYAALPWAAAAAVAFREHADRAGLAAVVLPLALASFASPTGGLLAGFVVLVLGTDRARVRDAATLLAAVAVTNLPWLLPGVLGSADASDPAGVSGFAARADTPYGVLGSVLSFGGIWKASVVPGERDSVLLVGLALLVTLASLAFLARAHRRLLGVGLVGLGLAVLPTWGPGNDLVTWLVREVPGAGLLRDSQKWSALLVLAACAGFALVLDAANRALRKNALPARAVIGTAVVFPVVLLPSFAWGIAGKLEPVGYPREWTQVRAVLDHQPAESRRIVVLPFSAYQAFAWNDGRAALDPAIRFFPGEVISNDALGVGGGKVVVGEDRTAASIAQALEQGRPLLPVLRSARVRYVLVERTAAGGARIDDADLVTAGRVLYDGSELRLIDLGSGEVTGTRPYAPVVVVGDLLALVAVTASGGLITVRRIHGKRDKIG